MTQATPKPSPGDSRDEYAVAAPVYDLFTARLLKHMRTDMAALLQSAGEGKTLDVCCGTGIFPRMLRQSGVSAHCLDISLPMLRQGTAASVPTVRADAACMPYASNTFAAASITLALHEMSPELRTQVLAEIMRVLSPGGSLFLLDYRTPQDFASHLAHCGIWFFEKMAGKRHYAMYRQFLATGATEALLAAHPLKYKLRKRYFQGSIGLFEATAV